jgi:hypothetical protein
MTDTSSLHFNQHLIIANRIFELHILVLERISWFLNDKSLHMQDRLVTYVTPVFGTLAKSAFFTDFSTTTYHKLLSQSNTCSGLRVS